MLALKQRSETHDRDLIAAVIRGDEAAFGQLVERYKERVFRLLGRYCRDSVECEDLAQEVFLKVFRKLHTFKHDSQFYTWLYRVTVNAATDHLSREGGNLRARARVVQLDAHGVGRHRVVASQNASGSTRKRITSSVVTYR